MIIVIASAAVVAVTAAEARFVVTTNDANDTIPEILALLEKIDKGFVALNAALIKKNIISQSCYPEE